MRLEYYRFWEILNLIMFTSFSVSCINNSVNVSQSTQILPTPYISQEKAKSSSSIGQPTKMSTPSPLSIENSEVNRLLPLDDSSFYYYVDGNKVVLTPSLDWIMIKFVSADPTEQFVSLKGSIVNLEIQARQISSSGFAVLPLCKEMTIEKLIFGINVLRADYSNFLQVNPVFQIGETVMIVTDEFTAVFPIEKKMDEIVSVNLSYGVEIVEPILGQANTLVLKVTNKARFDALAMANLYQETGIAEHAAPNFVRINKIDFLPVLP